MNSDGEIKKQLTFRDTLKNPSFKRVVLIDFDNTITKIDVLDYVIQHIHGVDVEEMMPVGLSGNFERLLFRINSLVGINVEKILPLLTSDILLDGYKQFFKWLKDEKFLSFIVSGNIDLIIQAYQPILGFSGIIATRTRVVKGVIQPVSVKDIQKNYTQIRGILGLENVLFNSFIFGIGNNFYDEAIFAVADHSVLFNGDTEMRNKLTFDSIEGDLYDLQRYLSSQFDK